MFDLWLRPIKERLLFPFASALDRRVRPMTVTLAGFLVGTGAAVLAARATFGLALGCWLLNRLLDGFDGTLARAQHAESDIGGYADLLLDFVVYAAIPVGLVLGSSSADRATLAVAALALIGTFYVNAASWMYLSALLERRGMGARMRGELTSVTMPQGLVGGTETIVFYTLFFLLPAHLVALFLLMAALIVITIVQRFVWAVRQLGD
ncbi:MAG: CDP-alcohol phosphatidyltransferase family protein [Gemmatimonadaceae bacterium]